MAKQHLADNVALGDATQLPFADQSFDAIVCAMALMLIAPLPQALGEMARVLRPAATLHVLLPTTCPLNWVDRARLASLFATLRTTPRFPVTPLHRKARDALGNAGFTITSDERQRYD